MFKWVLWSPQQLNKNIFSFPSSLLCVINLQSYLMSVKLPPETLVRWPLELGDLAESGRKHQWGESKHFSPSQFYGDVWCRLLLLLSTKTN